MPDQLFRKDFSLVVIGQVISILGSAILRFALDLYVLDITGRADVFALVLALSAVPGILFTPFGGAIADRFSRRNLMVIFDFCSGTVVLLLLFLLGAGHPRVSVVGVVLAVLSLISAAYQPTVQASVPVLVSAQNLPAANGIVSGVGALSGLLGPVLGGVLYGAAGLKVLVAISCAAFFLSAAMELLIHIPFNRQARGKRIIPTIAGDVKDGARYVVKEKPLIFRIILLAAALNLFMTPFLIIGVPYILRITLRSSEMMYGIGMGIAQLSTILGAVLVGVLSRKMTISTLYRPLFATAACIVPMAIAIAPIILSLGYWPAFALFFTSGGGVMLLSTVISIFVITSVQRNTPNEMLGKVMAIIMGVSQCAAPLGQALYGFVFEQFKTATYVPVLFACLSTVAIAIAAKQILKEHEEIL